MTTKTAYTSNLLTHRDPDAPALWVGCLAAYNAGKLHGEWMQVSSDPTELHEAIQEILTASPEPHAEEWEIMDTDNMPPGVTSVERAAAYVAALEGLGHYNEPAAVLAAWIEWRGWDDLSAEHIQDAYLGQFDSVQDYAEQFLADSDALREVPEFLRPYIDTKALGRDLALSGDVYEGNGGHLFNGHA